jgi:hypothetical protein
MTFAEKVIKFNSSLELTVRLPDGIELMNPFVENKQALDLSSKFYQKYYNNNKTRKIILGINPGRHGAGVTGIPFTDTNRLASYCNLEMHGVSTYEISSVFIYEMIKKYGGVKKFYTDFYINSVCPLGFVKKNNNNAVTNFNYYDSNDLARLVRLFIIKTLKTQISFGIDTTTCYCLGTGKNYKFLMGLNNEFALFNNIIPIEHPRYIMQYKRKQQQFYTDKYIQLLRA